MRALKMRSVVASYWKLIVDQLRAIIEADPLTTTWAMAEECNVNHSTIHLTLKQIGKVKKLAKWMPHELTANQKNHHFEVLSYLILCNNKSFLGQIVMSDQKWYNRLWLAQCWEGEEAPDLFPKPKKVPEKGHGHCLVVCCWSGPLQLSKSWQSHYIREVCSANGWDTLKTANACNWHWSTERTQFFCIMPDLMSYKQGFKSWANWDMKFCLIHHIHLTSCQPSTTSSSILTAFCRENASTTSSRQKMLSKSSSNPEIWIFTLQE